MAALGGYLRGLRDGQHISRTGLAGDLGVDSTTLWRIEEGKQEPGGGLLVTLVRVLRGSFDDVAALIADKNAKEIDGVRLAETRLSLPEQARIVAFRENPANYNTVSLAHKVERDPELRRAFIQVVDALRDLEDQEPTT